MSLRPDTIPALETGRKSSPSLLLVGNPNVGKSVLFGALTGRYVQVSNYPGTTVEVTRGTMTGSPERVDVIDTPGTNHLIPMSEDERVTRDILLREPDGTVVQVGDAKNLRRVLALTIEIALLGRPAVLALNMMDEARSLGVRIDRERLSARLGIPVVETVAIRGTGLRALRQAPASAAVPRIAARYPGTIERAIARIEKVLPPTEVPSRFLAILFLAGDPTILPWLRERAGAEPLNECERIRLETARAIPEPLSQAIQKAHLEAVDEALAECYVGATRKRGGWTHRVARWSVHPIRGLGMLAAVLALTFWFVGLLGAGTFVDLMESGLFGQVLSPLAIEATDAVMPFPHSHPKEEVSVSLEVPLTPAHGLPTGLAWGRRVVTPAYE
ncbi:MAG: FeoB small GTPase domain-containing protein, partial [Candidatus Eisenbacteria bacterium]|nr:FeoB small GTPase domain-containing protein [Candidatus Eisenbacteria bacterium]